MKIKKGDNVIVLTGKDKSRQGKVLKTLPEISKVIIESVNLKKKRTRPRKQGEKGQVIDKPAPVHVSNVGLYCSSCKKGVRMKAKIIGDKKSRVCAKCGKEL